MALTIDCAVHFKSGRTGHKHLVEGEKPSAPAVVAGNTPRVTKLLALAIKLERLVSNGDVLDYADLARLGQVSRARITQIMNMLHLAPDIQEAILFLPRTTKGRDPIRERDIRSIAAIPQWNRQRKMWSSLVNNNANIRAQNQE